MDLVPRLLEALGRQVEVTVRGIEWARVIPEKLPRLAGIPILFLLSESSYHAPYDHCTALYLKQAGVDNDFVRLTDLGIRGNGHLLLIEDNSTELAAWVERWLAKRLRRDPRFAAGSGRNDTRRATSTG